jgi:hypothetical protein
METVSACITDSPRPATKQLAMEESKWKQLVRVITPLEES